MIFLTTYEASLRSYIQSRIALEEEVRNRESENFTDGVTRRVHQICAEIKTHRLTNMQAAEKEGVGEGENLVLELTIFT